MEKLIQSLANDLQKLNASEGHAMMHNINRTQGLTAVVSVYDQVKPSHMVLDELYEWAETHSPELMKKIGEIALDMNWNK